MKLVLQRNNLLKELTYIAPIVERNAKNPILSHVLISATENDSVLLCGSNADLSIRSHCSAVVKSSGSIALPSREFKDTVSRMPEDSDIEISAESNERALVLCGKSRIKMVCLPEEQFPAIPPMREEHLSIPGELFNKMIRMTIFASTQDQHRFTLNGVLMVISNNCIKMVATDSHRMAHVEALKTFEKVEGEKKILIPRRTVAELSKMLHGDMIEILFAQDDNHLYFQVQNRLLVSRMLAGQFPNYEMVLPRNLQNHVTINVKALKEAISRVVIFADETYPRVSFRLEDQKLVMKSENMSKGEAEEEMKVDYVGDPIRMGFNIHYLEEFLDVVEKEDIVLEFTNEEVATMIKPWGEAEYIYKYVVMPISV